VVICLKRGANCLHMVQLMPLHSKTPSSLASFKSRLVLPFWYRLAQVVLEKRPLNECISQWRHQGEGGKLPPYGWTSKNYVICVCGFIVMELLCITRQIHCKAVEQRATLIQRQYNRDWGTSYSRPPIDPYLTSPCYKILAAPLVLVVVVKFRVRLWLGGR